MIYYTQFTNEENLDMSEPWNPYWLLYNCFYF